MADGSLDLELLLQSSPTLTPLIIDSFAGGGGASTGIEMALGRSPDIAINHDEAALSMHEANHPETHHLSSNIWQIDPDDVVMPGQKVGLAWFSPDCTHHSRAKGGKPVKKNIRDLAWVVVLWVQRVKPEVIMLENVPEFLKWGPLGADDRPLKENEGETFDKWVSEIRKHGYKVEWRMVKCYHHGAPTIRQRLLLIARRDGRPIVWPEPTHDKPSSPAVISGARKPWRTAAEIIDWTLPCPSIFDTSSAIKEKFGLRAQRPLKDNTLRRIAKGVQRYVIDAQEPFFVTYGQHGGANRSASNPMHTVTASPKDQNALVVPHLISVAHGDSGGRREYPMEEPIGTMTGKTAQHALIAPTLVSYYGEGNGGKDRSSSMETPVNTVTTANRHAVVAAFLAQHNKGAIGRKADAPLATITARPTQINLVAASMMSMHGNDRRDSDIRQPIQSLCAGGGHAALIGAFLTKYNGTDQDPKLGEPLHTVTTKDRFGLVMVNIHGQEYLIYDIGMRMLSPQEMYRAQSFPDTYEIETGHDGRKFTKTEQTRMCGNSVPPEVVRSHVAANCGHLIDGAPK